MTRTRLGFLASLGALAAAALALNLAAPAAHAEKVQIDSAYNTVKLYGAAPDGRTAAANITAADIATTSVAGQNSVNQVTGTPTASSSLTWALNGQSAFTITTTGTFSATCQIETSGDAGTTYVASTAKQLGTAATSSSVTGKGTFRVDVTGATNIRLRCPTFVSGTLAAYGTASPAPGLTQILNPVPLRGVDGLTSASLANRVPVGAFITDVAGVAIDWTATTPVKGGIAIDAPISDAPVLVGCRASTAAPTAMSADNDLQAVRCDLNGNTISRQAPLANSVSGVISSAMTGTTTTSLIAAPASGLRNYVTHIACYNTHASVDTLVNVQDGSGGTTIYQVFAPHGGGASLTLPHPLRQPTTATALFVADVTTGASVTCSASGYKASE